MTPTDSKPTYFRTQQGRLGIQESEIGQINTWSSPMFQGRLIEFDKTTQTWRWGRKDFFYLRHKSRFYFFKRVPKRYLLQILQANLHDTV